MKLRMILFSWGLAVAGALGFGGVTLAQNVPEKFVVSGKYAEQIQDFSTVNLATAESLANSCEKAATEQGVQVTVMVLDHAGNHVYSDRMDGQGYLNIVTAEWKARTALVGREPSKVHMNAVIKNPAEEAHQIQLGFFANSGGLPIVANKQLIGAIGVGGSAPHVPVWSDEICGHKALEAVIGPTVAPLIEDLPPRQAPQGTAPVPKFASATVPKTSLNPDWVVGGKGAANVFDANQISLAAAKKIGSVCRDWAASKGGTMSLYILDNAGEFVHMERMDGQRYVNIHTALLKAQTALKSRAPTSIRAAQLKNNPDGITRSVFLNDFYGVSGGLPIVVDGQMIGAIGVGGGAGGGDENCAIEGLKATFGDHVMLPEYPAAAAAAQ
jgi:glc operon protein GlcG